MEISNLTDAGFKTLVVRILKELTGYFRSIKKSQAEMKVALSEIKKNVQGNNSGGDEPVNQIGTQDRKKHSIRTVGRIKNSKIRAYA